ncbi:MAG TPA: L-threonylcarbamoyladenylate synthase [Candidatus Moranbacteria bacterium]|nr:L-threonylcarbamoyladenylate synthase [Candidatus Moranbacteria bacterium]HSA08507.1 L-threonylcarbamoyladenylate synthase [Candidatus Moranbacteria bacterium]
MKKEKNTKTEKDVISILRSGGVGVLPTDTLYGLVGSALQKEPVERIYALRKRYLNSPMIILISSADELKLFGIKINLAQRKIIEDLWPGRISFVLDCPFKKFEYLHRGVQTLAFRVPKYKWLSDILKKTGPLVAPSANISGEKPAETPEEAEKYFSNKVDFYADGGRLESEPSTLVRLDREGKLEVLRPGAVDVQNLKTPKRKVYMFFSIILGLLSGLMMYLLVKWLFSEMEFMQGDFVSSNNGNNLFLPVEKWFLLSGLCFGIWFGLWGWRVAYIEKRQWKCKKR